MPERKWAYALVSILAAGIYAVAQVSERRHPATPADPPARMRSESRNEDTTRRILEGIGHFKDLKSVPLPSTPEH